MKKLIHSDLLNIRISIDESKKIDRHPVKIILNNIRSLYNVGSLFRTADSALLSELVMCGFTPHPPRKEIEKTALGAVDTVPWSYYQNIEDAISKFRNEGWKIAALELCDNGRQYNSLKKEDFPLCIILGNELTGIDDSILELCDFALEIPMYGVKHSLNVSVAGGIAIYSAIETLKKME
jgi:tRNA G18 (ribose-2'-O)-methylase SpoU